MGLLRTIGTLKEDDRIRTEFVDHLPASTARRAGYAMIIGDRHGLDLDFRTQLGNGREDRRAFRAVRHSVRSILDVAAAENLSIGKKDGRPDSKLRIRRVRVLHYLGRRLFEFLPHDGG